ncbi:MAG: Uncharacterised protein [Formosa sp. Hel3_A1_48]|nr:MAG: Uncharacterised protein [Formosa sp. Hel3_A1_48]
MNKNQTLHTYVIRLFYFFVASIDDLLTVN